MILNCAVRVDAYQVRVTEDHSASLTQLRCQLSDSERIKAFRSLSIFMATRTNEAHRMPSTLASTSAVFYASKAEMHSSYTAAY